MRFARSFCIVFIDEIRHAIKSRRAFLVFLSYLMVMNFLGYNFIRVKLEILRRMALNKTIHYNEAINKIATEWLRSTTDLADYLLDIPILLLLFFLASIFLLPAFILLMSFDTLSGEVHEGSMRYLIPRASRASIYTAKLFASLVIATTTTILVTYMFCGITLYFNIETDTAKVLFYARRFSLLLFFCGFPFAAITIAFSAMFRKPMASLFGGLGFLILLPLISTIVAHLQENVVSYNTAMLLNYIHYLAPHVFIRGFFYPPGHLMNVACLAYVVYGVIYVCIGFVFFAHRDLT